MTVGSILGDAFDLYRLLFRRSVAAAAIVYAVVALFELAAELPEGQGARIVLGLVSFAVGFSGPVLVQGALVRIVRNIHEGERPETIGELLRAARHRIWSLLLASIVYGLGVAGGLLLFIAPGLLAAARWCLMAPLIMLEGDSAGNARRRSSELVRGTTWTVLGAIVVSFLLVTFVEAAFISYWGLSDRNVAVDILFGFAWSSISAPFTAHVLTVIYYKLVDPDRPVVHENVRSWTSLWSEG
jgi:hypothetical protein